MARVSYASKDGYPTQDSTNSMVVFDYAFLRERMKDSQTREIGIDVPVTSTYDESYGIFPKSPKNTASWHCKYENGLI